MRKLLNLIRRIFKRLLRIFKPRFKMIQVEERGISKGWHVGVLDRERKMVLELVKDLGIVQDKAIIQEISEKRFGGHGRYKILNYPKFKDSESRIKKRWEDTLYKFKNATKPIPYHVSGDPDYGMNCEYLATYIMTGIGESRNGRWAGYVYRITGINLGNRDSRNPASLD